jgi:hypothetical protein
VVGTGCVAWGISTYFLGEATEYRWALVLAALNGVALASVTPAACSLLVS